MRAALIILGLMSENNPPHRNSMEHVAKFTMFDSARLLQALQSVRTVSVRTVEVSLRYGAMHTNKTKVGAARAFAEKVESMIVDSHDGANRIQDRHWYKGASDEWGSLILTICANVWLRQSKPVIAV